MSAGARGRCPSRRPTLSKQTQLDTRFTPRYDEREKHVHARTRVRAPARARTYTREHSTRALVRARTRRAANVCRREAASTVVVVPVVVAVMVMVMDVVLSKTGSVPRENNRPSVCTLSVGPRAPTGSPTSAERKKRETSGPCRDLR